MSWLQSRRRMLQMLSGCVSAFGLGLVSGAAGPQSPSREYRIGILASGPMPSAAEPRAAAMIRGLAERGYEIGRNLVIEQRAADGEPARLPQLVAELIEHKVEAIVTFGYPAALAAKHATSTVPIIVTGAGDPVATGLVDGFARPGGNVTGFSEAASELSGKRLELLIRAVPGMKRVAMLWNANDLAMILRYQTIAGAAQSLGVAVEELGVRGAKDFDDAFGAMRRERPDAILVIADTLTLQHRGRVIEFATAHHLPSMFELPPFVHDGGLMSYGADMGEIGARAAGMIDRIFKGARPAELPIEQPAHFLLVLNLKVAAALGLAVPPDLLARADEVIE
jgi:putative ABC transport system substrate-binding protein